MKSYTQRNKIKMATVDMAIIGVMSAILFVAQVALSFLPNIEVVTLLIIVYTLVLERRTLFVIYIFALLEGLFYGFGPWWIMYLYVWTILYLVIRILRKNESVLVWSLAGGFFGLSFGALCSIPYIAMGGFGAGLAWWVAGLYYDVLHGIGNVVVIFLLFKPIYGIVKRVKVIGAFS